MVPPLQFHNKPLRANFGQKLITSNPTRKSKKLQNNPYIIIRKTLRIFIHFNICKIVILESPRVTCSKHFGSVQNSVKCGIFNP
jgi:hypothetical protein